MSRFALAKDYVQRSLDTLVPELFGSGRKQTHRFPARWAVTNKWRAGADITQMSVWRDGGRRGAFKDFVSGEKGDAIDLIAFGLEGIIHADSRMRAIDWIEERFGLKAMDEATRSTITAEAEKRRVALEADEQKRAGADKDRTRKFFHGSGAQILGTPVEIYLSGRGIVLEDVPNLSTAFRYRPDCEYWPGGQRDGEGNPIGRKPRFPALISAMVDGEGSLRACHYTFLEPDGTRKLDTRARGYFGEGGKPSSAKLMYPASGGLSIPVTFGAGGMMVRDAAAAGKLGWMGITEGIEDALSVAVSHGELRLHAAGSLAHLGAIADCPAARGYLVFRDNDWAKPQAVAQFDAAIARLRSFGKPVDWVAMPEAWGKDVNDALNASSAS